MYEEKKTMRRLNIVFMGHILIGRAHGRQSWPGHVNRTSISIGYFRNFSALEFQNRPVWKENTLIYHYLGQGYVGQTSKSELATKVDFVFKYLKIKLIHSEYLAKS